MNGDERDRLIKLETKFKERWDSHDKRSEEIWDEVRDKLDSICGRKEKCMNESRNYVHKMIAFIFSVSAFIFVIIRITQTFAK